MACTFGAVDDPALVWDWIKWGLYGVGMLGTAIGLLSFFSPRNSIKLYQTIMTWFNWRVEPIHWDREIRNTRWLGFLMVILSLAITCILLTGCAHQPFSPWGYRSISFTKKGSAIIPPEGEQHEWLGFISHDKAEVLYRFGMPDFISSGDVEAARGRHKVREWIYLAAVKRFYFSSGSGNLYFGDDLTPLDVASFKGSLEAGMSREQVKRVKGEPSSIESANLNYGATEKWFYKKDNRFSECLYFAGDMLLLWQKEDLKSGKDPYTYGLL